MYDYPEAGKNASQNIKDEIEQFKKLPLEAKENLPLLYYILKDGTPPYKMSKEDSQYANKSEVKGQECRNCHFAYQKIKYKDVNICSQIEGRISHEGWCKLWKA